MTINNRSTTEDSEPFFPEQDSIDTHNMGSVSTASATTDAPLLHNYVSMRESLWDIHDFVRQVLNKEAPGFRITAKKNGDKRIEALALGEQFYRRMNNYMARIPRTGPAAGFVGLYLDCCIELKLFYNPFGKPGDFHRPGMNGAELFNALLELIRTRAKRDKRCKKFLNFDEDFDLEELSSVVDYFNALFVDYTKILTVRVDLGYAADEADKITFEKARSDIKRFVNNRHWHGFFEHCIGFVIGRERGTGSVQENGGTGRGYHFHCFVLFDGQKEKNDVELAKKIIDYWENRIVNSPRRPLEPRIKTWHRNCNAVQTGYQYNGIGMVQHFDELKRWHMIFALIYLTKRSQALGDDVPPRTKALTKGEHIPHEVEARGRPRQLMINGQLVRVPRQAMRVGGFLQPRDMV